MKNIMTIATTVACAFALTACGGGGGSSSDTTSNLADVGIWSNLTSNGASTSYAGMQAIILSDGSYWGIYGSVEPINGTFNLNGILHGTASVSGSSVSGAYTNIPGQSVVNGTYSGTVSAQNNLSLTFNEPSDTEIEAGGEGNFNLSYDNIYNQPISLSTIAGNYPATGPTTISVPPSGISINNIYPDDLIISGANLTLYQNGNVIMTGTIAQHGTTSVFDISLTTATAGTIGGFSSDISVGTVFKGILFNTSFGILTNNIEIISEAGNNAFVYFGSK